MGGLQNRSPSNRHRTLIDDAKDLDAIMDYVRENPQSIETYAGMLKETLKKPNYIYPCFFLVIPIY